MGPEFIFLLAFLVLVWLPVTIVFLRQRRPIAVKAGKKKAYRLNRRYRRYFKPTERKMQDQACRLLSEIDDALQRIEDRKYGICEGTDKPISKARLEAQPWARYCVEHAQMLEQGQAGEQEQ